jgi:hypothetical protein
MSTVTAISFKPKATKKRLKKEILSDDFKKRKIFRMGKFCTENFPPHITTCLPFSATRTHMTLRETFAAKHSNVHVNMRWLLGFLTFIEDRILHVHAPAGF